MCLFSKPKTVTPPPAPKAPAPAPVITPSEVSPQSAEETRQSSLRRIRSGLASTIKTSPRGITGNSAELASAGIGGKTALGQ